MLDVACQDLPPLLCSGRGARASVPTGAHVDATAARWRIHLAPWNCHGAAICGPCVFRSKTTTRSALKPPLISVNKMPPGGVVSADIRNLTCFRNPSGCTRPEAGTRFGAATVGSWQQAVTQLVAANWHTVPNAGAPAIRSEGQQCAIDRSLDITLVVSGSWWTLSRNLAAASRW